MAVIIVYNYGCKLYCRYGVIEHIGKSKVYTWLCALDIMRVWLCLIPAVMVEWWWTFVWKTVRTCIKNVWGKRRPWKRRSLGPILLLPRRTNELVVPSVAAGIDQGKQPAKHLLSLYTHTGNDSSECVYWVILETPGNCPYHTTTNLAEKIRLAVLYTLITIFISSHLGGGHRSQNINSTNCIHVKIKLMASFPSVYVKKLRKTFIGTTKTVK